MRKTVTNVFTSQMKSEEHHKNMNLLMDKVVVKQKDFQKDPQRQLLNQSSDRQMYSVKKKKKKKIEGKKTKTQV